MDAVPLSLDDREALLDAEVLRYVQAGFLVVVRTPTSAQLARPKVFDAGAAVLGLLFCGLGLAVYLLGYLGRPTDAVYLFVDERGHLHAVPYVAGRAHLPPPRAR